MTIIETPSISDQTEVSSLPAADSAQVNGTAPITECGSYKEAKYLAAARRRSGDIDIRHAYAVYLTSRQSWCVK